MSDKIIQIQNVNKWFGDFQALKDQNITLCWMQNNKIVTFKKDKWSDTRPAIKWLL